MQVKIYRLIYRYSFRVYDKKWAYENLLEGTCGIHSERIRKDIED